MRAQYHFRPSPEGLRAWDVRKLVAAVSKLPVVDVPLSDIGEVDENWWFTHEEPTVRAITNHLTLIEAAELRYPILLCPEGRLIDGMHRIAKTISLGHTTVKARKLRVMPPPDFVGVAPGALPYD